MRIRPQILLYGPEQAQNFCTTVQCLNNPLGQPISGALDFPPWFHFLHDSCRSPPSNWNNWSFRSRPHHKNFPCWNSQHNPGIVYESINRRFANLQRPGKSIGWDRIFPGWILIPDRIEVFRSIQIFGSIQILSCITFFKFVLIWLVSQFPTLKSNNSYQA